MGEVMAPVLDLLRRDGLVVDGGHDDEKLLLKGVAWILRFGDRPHLGLVAPLEVPTCPLHPNSI
jgi:hypothetical protein